MPVTAATQPAFPTLAAIRGLMALVIALLCPVAWAATDVSDSDIVTSVEQELMFDQAIPEQNIDVNSKDGIVILKGRVNNLLARERATRLAETVKGVRAVTNRIDVVPLRDYAPRVLHDAIADALFADAATESYEVRINVGDEGHVTLDGRVESWQERQLAGKVAKGVAGVTSLENNIAVSYEEPRADAEMEREIEEALRWNVLVDSAMIDVQVDQGKVTLSGTVGSAAEKHQASLTAWVNGVTQVNSKPLEVAKWARDPELRKAKYSDKSDPKVKQAIRAALRTDPRVAGQAVDVDVSEGFVTLQGKVDNIKAKQVAERDARNTVGVVGVTNLIKVRTEQPRSDDVIAARVRSALDANAHTEANEITVRVVDGSVYLDGEVDTVFEKATAEDLASRVAGVVHVRNAIAVQAPRAVSYDPYVDDMEIRDYPWYAVDRIFPKKRDHEIRKHVKDELFWSPFIDSDQVEVDVDAGVVTLQGEVDSWREYDVATENALEGGAVTVNNQLTVD